MNIIQEIVPSGMKSRPAKPMDAKYITVHNTGNTGVGANALAHASLLKRAALGSTGWHFTVDDARVIQHIPTNENAYHAGDGAGGTGNTQSIGVEICENSDGNYEKAEALAIDLIRYLMARENIPIENVKPHKHWSGKICPHKILPRWGAFIAIIKNVPVVKPTQKFAMVLEITAKIGLNMRTEPIATAGVVVTIPFGERVSATESNGGWYKASYSGKTGWVSATYVNNVTPASQPTSAPTPKAEPVEMFRVRKSWADAASQVGSYISLDGAKTKADEYTNQEYKVFDNNGKVVYVPVIPVVVVAPQPIVQTVEEPKQTPQEASVGQSVASDTKPDVPIPAVVIPVEIPVVVPVASVELTKATEQVSPYAAYNPMQIVDIIVVVCRFILTQFDNWGWIRK